MSRRLAAAAAVLMLVAASGVARGAPAAARPAALRSAAPLGPAKTAAIARLVEAVRAKSGAPGVSVAVGVGGELVWAKGFGLADVENGVPATPDTAYRSASLAKPMTAVAALRLAEAGKLDLDAPIQRYCPRYPAKDQPVTARDLITHTSGIRDLGGANVETEVFGTRHYDHASDGVDLFKDDPLKQPPGTAMLYSTAAYVVLGCVVEGASGQAYLPAMQALVFGPAGMSATRDDDARAVVPHRAAGYGLEGGQLRRSRFVDVSNKTAAAGLLTTAPDLVRFVDDWMDGRLVGPATRQAMMSPYKPPRGDLVEAFGLGWFLDDFHGQPAVFYAGRTSQVSGVVYAVPGKRVAVAVMFNLESVPGPDRLALARQIAEVLTGEKPTPPKPAA